MYLYIKNAPYNPVRLMCVLNTEMAHITETAPFSTVCLMVVKIQYINNSRVKMKLV